MLKLNVALFGWGLGLGGMMEQQIINKHQAKLNKTEQQDGAMLANTNAKSPDHAFQLGQSETHQGPDKQA
jgi:hypothetical protein